MAHIAYESELQIASGWNNVAGLTAITSIADSDGIAFNIPNPFQYVAGRRYPLLSRRTYTLQEEAVSWKWTDGNAVTVKQHDKLITDYVETNDAKVTVRTFLRDGSSGNYNARIVINADRPEMAQNQTGLAVRTPGNNRANWLPLIVTFNIISAIT